MRNRTQIKRAVVVKREWEAATVRATQRVASLTSECAIMKVIFQEREHHLRAKKMNCEVLELNLAKEKECSAQ